MKDKVGFFGIPKIFPYLKQYKGLIAAMVIMGIISSVIETCGTLSTAFNVHLANYHQCH